MTLLQIVFLENLFLVLTDEGKVGEKRSPAREIMLACRRLQIINFRKKTLGLIRKMRNVIKLFLLYYKQKNYLLSQHPNDCLCHTWTQCSFHQRLSLGKPPVCSHEPILSVKALFRLLASHLNSSSAWLQPLLGARDCRLDIQGKQIRAEELVLELTGYTMRSLIFRPLPGQPRPSHRFFLPSYTLLSRALTWHLPWLVELVVCLCKLMLPKYTVAIHMR